MKIFYAVQATGNGHISRAMELIPHLQQYGEVDIFLSGNNSHLSIDAPVKYRSKGLSLYYNSKGGLDYWKIFRGIHPFNLRREINDLPLEKYDLVINDFEFITSASCAKKRIPSIQLGHQASFQSALTPRPENKNIMGEWLLKNYAKASHYIGLHFEQYADFIFYPVIKKDILDAQPIDKGHITVYLPSYSSDALEKIFQPFRDRRFHIFSREFKTEIKKANIVFLPVNKELFNKSLIECSGTITGAGFETPAEALYLGKKILAIPARGQYEQQCNAAALGKMGVTCFNKIDRSFPLIFEQWLEMNERLRVNYTDTIPQIMNRLLAIHASIKDRSFGEARNSSYNTEPAISF